MPEEIGIALVIIVIVGWLLVKILQAFGRAIGETLKGISDSHSVHSKARFTQNKSRLSQYVSVALPGQLEAAEQAVNAVQRRLQTSKEETPWEARRPFWVREEFRSHILPTQSDTYYEMNAEDIGVILQSESRKWVEQEAKLLSESCKYPHSEPQMPPINFTPIGLLTLRLDEARFQYDHSKLSEGKINKYFDTERRSAIAYNERRAGLTARLDKLNNDIHEWNDQSRAAWEACVRETQQFLTAELITYGRAADLYTSQ